MFDDYKKNVIRAFQKKRDANDISINLVRPSPKKLKIECLTVYKERPLKKDEQILRSFFGAKDNVTDYSQSINKFEIEKFKALINFIQGKTVDPDERIVELLAWLMDFEPRPFTFGKNYNEDLKAEGDLSGNVVEPEKIEDTAPSISFKSEKIIEPNEAEALLNNKENIKEDYGTELSITIPGDPEVLVEQSFGIPRKFNKTVVAFFATLFILGGSFILYDKSKHQCMYWDKDHYESVACNEKIDGKVVVALDTFRLSHLKKITNIKSITKKDIGKVYYSKIDGIVEFYETGGENPTDNHRRLLPMTDYMFEKYVLPK